METTISTWGNSEAVRIPRDILRSVGLRKGDRVAFEVNSRGRIELVPGEASHRRVVPAKGVTFESLFRGYEGDAVAQSGGWPTEDMVGAEWDAWSR